MIITSKRRRSGATCGSDDGVKGEMLWGEVLAALEIGTTSLLVGHDRYIQATALQQIGLQTHPVAVFQSSLTCDAEKRNSSSLRAYKLRARVWKGKAPCESLCGPCLL